MYYFFSEYARSYNTFYEYLTDLQQRKVRIRSGDMDYKSPIVDLKSGNYSLVYEDESYKEILG